MVTILIIVTKKTTYDISTCEKKASLCSMIEFGYGIRGCVKPVIYFVLDSNVFSNCFFLG